MFKTCSKHCSNCSKVCSKLPVYVQNMFKTLIYVQNPDLYGCNNIPKPPCRGRWRPQATEEVFYKFYKTINLIILFLLPQSASLTAPSKREPCFVISHTMTIRNYQNTCSIDYNSYDKFNQTNVGRAALSPPIAKQ